MAVSTENYWWYLWCLNYTKSATRNKTNRPQTTLYYSNSKSCTRQLSSGITCQTDKKKSCSCSYTYSNTNLRPIFRPLIHTDWLHEATTSGSWWLDILSTRHVAIVQWFENTVHRSEVLLMYMCDRKFLTPYIVIITICCLSTELYGATHPYITNITTGWEVRGIESRCGLDFSHPSGSVLEPTLPTVQWLSVLSRAVKRPGRGVDHLPPCRLEVKERV